MLWALMLLISTSCAHSQRYSVVFVHSVGDIPPTSQKLCFTPLKTESLIEKDRQQQLINACKYEADRRKFISVVNDGYNCGKSDLIVYLFYGSDTVDGPKSTSCAQGLFGTTHCNTYSNRSYSKNISAHIGQHDESKFKTSRQIYAGLGSVTSLMTSYTSEHLCRGLMAAMYRNVEQDFDVPYEREGQ